MSLRPTYALLLLAALHGVVRSQPSEGAAPAGIDYVVTASRTREPTASSVRPVTVITAEDIRLAGAGSLSELLRSLGGVELSANGGIGQISSVFIRGANSDHTVVLIDGVRVGSATTGTAALESIPLALIERVEVLPGPASSLYGSDAIGGVIQVFTRSMERSPGLSVAATAGSRGLRQLSAQFAGRPAEGTELALAVQRLSSDGFNATTPDNLYGYNADSDGLLNQGLSARLVQQWDGDQQAGVQWLRSRATVHYDDGPAPLDTRSNTLTESLAAHWHGRLPGGVRTELRVGRSRDESDDISAFPGFFNTRQDQISWLNRLALAGGNATLGLEWLQQTVDSSTAYTRAEREVRSGLLGWRGQWGGHTLQAELRQDRNSQFGQHGTGQLAWAWQAGAAWRWRAGLGSAFHAPSFNLLYYPDFGNPLLRPERSRSAEAGLDVKAGALDIGATAFDNRIRDLIDYAPPNYDPQNIASAHIRGLTLSAAGALGSGWRAKLNLTLQDPENADSGARLRRRARVFGAAHLVRTQGPLQWGSDLTWVGRRFDAADESPASAMGAYGLIALMAGWVVSPDWRLEARVDNAGDKRYTTAQGYRAPGREAQITLRWTPAP